MKVHITLVGGQPAPVYHGIVAIAPDLVVYIYSNNSQRALDALLSEVHLPSEQYLLDPTDPTLIQDKAKELAKRFATDEVTVNISSGLKSWAYFFSIVFDRCTNAAVVYMDQNNVLWNYRTMTSSTDFKFDMHTLFRLYGNPLNHFKRLSDYTTEDLCLIPEIEKARRFCYDDFKDLTSTLNKKRQQDLKTKEGCFDSPRGSYVEWLREKEKNAETIHLYLQKRNGDGKEYIWSSPHAIDIVFNTAWFELKIANMISHWAKAHEVLLNCRFLFRADVDKNEVDIIVNTGNKILFIECKTQIFNNTDIDKFKAVVNKYGGTGSKGLFITMEKMSEIAMQKCTEHDLLHFSLADDHKGLSAQQELFTMLDERIMNINAK